ncbi:MAG: hypothetical protein HY901_31445 [Deltaproteobacteria bacterium]|nr:hypothetical protein [Deltaproteobacteria bacterium]
MVPPLLLLGGLFALARGARVFDRARRTATRSVRWLAWAASEEVTLPERVVVELTTHCSMGGSESSGYREWAVEVRNQPGLRFVTFAGHSRARAFAELLAGFLASDLEDAVPEEHRRERAR